MVCTSNSRWPKLLNRAHYPEWQMRWRMFVNHPWCWWLFYLAWYECRLWRHECFCWKSCFVWYVQASPGSARSSGNLSYPTFACPWFRNHDHSLLSEMIWILPWSFLYAKFAQRPPGESWSGRWASVIKRYFQSVLGKASAGKQQLGLECLECLQSGVWKRSRLVAWILPREFKQRGAMIAKSWIWCRKKLQSLMKDRIPLMSLGGAMFLIAFSLASPGLIPSGVRVNPR